MKILQASLLFAVVTWNAASVQAFELGSLCKSTDLYYPIEGHCDSSGLLQGHGSASLTYPKVDQYYELISTGIFVDGIPDGSHVITAQNGLNCKAEFDNGTMLAKNFTCTSPASTRVKTGQSAGFHSKYDEKVDFPFTLNVDHAEGSIRIEKSEHKGWKIFIYMAQVEISSNVSVSVLDTRRASLSPKPMQAFSTFTGYVDELEVGLTGNWGMSIKASNMQTVIDDAGFTLEGTFSFNCHNSGNCTINRFQSLPVDGTVDSRALFEYTDKVNQRSYKIAFIGDAYRTSLIYFKDDKGLVFNGMRPQCQRNLFGNELIEDKNERRNNSSNAVLSFLPRCGEVTMPDGRYFDGLFELHTGKPIMQ